VRATERANDQGNPQQVSGFERKAFLHHWLLSTAPEKRIKNPIFLLGALAGARHRLWPGNRDSERQQGPNRHGLEHRARAAGL
jgi:hypothetical protein